jgi:hypothetical protein
MKTLCGRVGFEDDSNLSEITETTDWWFVVTLRLLSLEHTLHHTSCPERKPSNYLFGGIDAMHGHEVLSVEARWTLPTF